MPPIVYISRTESFSAAHRLHSVYLTDTENQETYGKCNRSNGHGHNYRVTVTVRGPVDQKTGMVMNLSDLKLYMRRICDTLDHRNLDKDIPFFKTHVSSAENIAIHFWNEMQVLLEAHDCSATMYEVKIDETDKNSSVYRGEESVE